MEIAPQFVMTKTSVPRIACRARPQPAMPLAPTHQSSPALLAMDAALQGAIALTTTTVLRPAPIILSRRERSATAIVRRRAMIQLPAPPIRSAEPQQIVTPRVFSPTSTPAESVMGAVQAGVIISTILTAPPAVVITLSKQTRFAMVIAPPPATTPTFAQPMY